MENYIIFGVVALITIWIIATYNKFIRLIEAVISSEKEISIQLDRRGKVFDSLLSTVKKYMEHEESIFTRVTELRNSAQNGTSKDVENELSEIISSGALQSSLNVTMENYPELKSNTNMIQLQEEIVSTENKLTFSKRAFNENIEAYNSTRKSLPDLLLPAIFSSLNKEFEYWHLSESKIKEEENKRINF